MKKLAQLFLAAAFAFFALTSAADIALAQATRSTVVGSGATVDINVHSDCRRVANGGGLAVLAPWDTAAEWQNFYNNPPSGVSISACPPSCGGYSYGGYCYRNGSNSASCDTVCGSFGGCNAAGVRFIGSDDPSGARCNAVMTAFYGTNTTNLGASDSIGCTIWTPKGGTISYNFYGLTTLCATTFTDYTRMCACNN